VTTGASLLLAAAVVLVLLAAWTAWTLTRLRRLEARVDRAYIALETQLARRAALAEELIRDHAVALGPGAAERLALAAAEARTPPSGDREAAENALGRELRDVADLDVPTALRADLTGTGTRLQLARQFYNDAVRDTRELRGRRLPRLLRLHGRRSLPRYFDVDDGLGGALPAPSAADRGADRP
jgi:hypothetical protein